MVNVLLWVFGVVGNYNTIFLPVNPPCTQLMAGGLMPCGHLRWPESERHTHPPHHNRIAPDSHAHDNTGLCLRRYPAAAVRLEHEQ